MKKKNTLHPKKTVTHRFSRLEETIVVAVDRRHPEAPSEVGRIGRDIGHVTGHPAHVEGGEGSEVEAVKDEGAAHVHSDVTAKPGNVQLRLTLRRLAVGDNGGILGVWGKKAENVGYYMLHKKVNSP